MSEVLCFLGSISNNVGGKKQKEQHANAEHTGNKGKYYYAVIPSATSTEPTLDWLYTKCEVLGHSFLTCDQFVIWENKKR